MAYKRILTVQDISCLGQCSMTVALPVLSACGHETCILPSKLLSTHTGGFGAPAVQDLSAAMEQTWQHWQDQGIRFDAVYSGYLGSAAAVSAVEKILDTLLAPGGVYIADPAMADHGKLYAGLDEAYAQAMIRLCRRADVVLPNLTELAMITGERMPQTQKQAEALLNTMTWQTVILTGVEVEPQQLAVAVRSDSAMTWYQHRRVGRNYHGTGDLFAACFTGSWLRGVPLTDAAALAANFTCKCVENTCSDPGQWYGVRFETALPELIRLLEDQ